MKNANSATNGAVGAVKAGGIEPMESIWKHILLIVKKRKRLANGEMGQLVQAVNMVTGDKCALIINPDLIDNQD